MMIEFREPGLLYPKQDLDSGPPSIANAVLARGMVQILAIPLHTSHLWKQMRLNHQGFK